jgi:hypothetical protein
LTTWRPLSQRSNEDAPGETLYEGVPAHLHYPLLHWLECQFYDYINLDPDNTFNIIYGEAADARALRIANRLRLTLPKQPPDQYGVGSFVDRHRPKHASLLIRLAKEAKESRLLDIVDAALADRLDPSARKLTLQSSGHPYQAEKLPNQPADLDSILREGGSAYRVSDDGTALERRVDSTITSLVRQTTSQSNSPSRHLEAAWRAAYGIKPDPTEAYEQAIKAIEAALVPIVLPNEKQGMLGGALGELSKQANEWELSILNREARPAEITPFVEFIRLIYRGQRDRHAGTPTTTPVGADAAEMAVHAAAMVIYWMSIEGLRRNPGTSRSDRHFRGGQGALS